MAQVERSIIVLLVEEGECFLDIAKALSQAGYAQLKGEPCRSEEDDEDEGDC